MTTSFHLSFIFHFSGNKQGTRNIYEILDAASMKKDKCKMANEVTEGSD